RDRRARFHRPAVARTAVCGADCPDPKSKTALRASRLPEPGRAPDARCCARDWRLDNRPRTDCTDPKIAAARPERGSKTNETPVSCKPRFAELRASWRPTSLLADAGPAPGTRPDCDIPASAPPLAARTLAPAARSPDCE